MIGGIGDVYKPMLLESIHVKKLYRRSFAHAIYVPENIHTEEFAARASSSPVRYISTRAPMALD